MRVARMPFLEIHHGKIRVQIVVPPRLRGIVGEITDKGKPVPKLRHNTGFGPANQREANELAAPIIAGFRAILRRAERRLKPRSSRLVRILPAFEKLYRDHPYLPVTEHEDGSMWVQSAVDPDAAEPTVDAPSATQPYEPVVELWAIKKNKISKAKRTRLSKLKRLFDWLGYNDMSRVTPADLSRYEEKSLLPMVTAGKWKHDTVRDHLIDLKAIFRFAKEQHKIATISSKSSPENRGRSAT